MKRKTHIEWRMAAAQMHALAAVRREIRYRDTSNSSCKYLRDFNTAYGSYERVLQLQELQNRISAATLLLVGDYHALPASQKFAGSLIEQLAQRTKIVLGVEAVLSRDQRHLDSWWRREIIEPELRRRLRFDREWGYDWQPFYELLNCARENCEGIYGLDCMPRNDLRSIRSRDRHAAEKIRELRERHTDAVILVLFGESHMAPQHLPASLRKLLPGERSLTVLQNLDSVYWEAMAQEAPAVSLTEDAVCVFNSSPLEKYESYRICLERWNAAAADESPDFAPAVYNLIFSLARCLGFRLDSPHNGTQPKFLADSLPEVVSKNEIPEQDVALGERGCVYIPQPNTIYIDEFEMFAAAREAARFLRCACADSLGRRETRNSEDEKLAYFGARLLCPGTPDDRDVNASGEDLYQSYLAGRTRRAQVRKMFLSA